MSETFNIATDRLGTRIVAIFREWWPMGVGCGCALLLHTMLLGIELPEPVGSESGLAIENPISVAFIMKAPAPMPMTQTVAAEPIQPPQKVPIVPSAKPAAVPQAQTMTAVETPSESIISTSVPAVIDTQTSLPVEPEQVAAPELTDAPATPAVETYRPPTPHVEGWVNRDPAYPYLARKRSLQGTVELLIQIDEQGLPAQITIASSSGYRLLDKAAEKAVWKWRFTPARQGDQAVAGELLVPIRFALEA